MIPKVASMLNNHQPRIYCSYFQGFDLFHDVSGSQSGMLASSESNFFTGLCGEYSSIKLNKSLFDF